MGASRGERDQQSRSNGGRETFIVFDNLHGQTTPAFKHALAKNSIKMHLLPGGMTDELQLIVDGVGIAVKNEMGQALDKWLETGENLALWWTGRK